MATLPSKKINTIIFTDSGYQDDLGIYSMGVRSYSPRLGRFLTPDPLFLEDPSVCVESPFECNLYSYAKNNPLVFTDKSGKNARRVPSQTTTLRATLNAGQYRYLMQQIREYQPSFSVLRAPGPVSVREIQQLNNHYNKIRFNLKNAPNKIPNIKISQSKYPESAQHILEAQNSGHPSILTIQRANASANRRKSLKNTPRQPGRDRDEYPPATFKEGGTGASIRVMSPRDNRGAGASMGAQMRKLPNGSKVRIEVTD